MGIEYYAFALFITALICIIAIIFKVLFANVKRQKKLLDERESEVLRLYGTIETIMEEFSDQVKASMDEIKASESRATTQISESVAQAQNSAVFEIPPELEKKEQIIEKVQLPRTEPFSANRIRAAEEVLERAERIAKHDLVVNEEVAIAEPEKVPQNTIVFQKFFDDAVDAPPQPPESPRGAPSKNEKILELANEGKTDIEIASQLGITRSEVQLITSLTR